jgi:AraC-like DNA-binding protein
MARLPRPVFARVESLPAGSFTLPHGHAWVQFSFAVSGVLEVRTPSGNFVAPPHWAVWVPPGVVHEVVTSDRAEMRSLYLDSGAVARPVDRCQVLEITPLARELILAVAALPPEYDLDGPGGRLVAVLLDQLAALPEAGFSLPLPGDARLAAVCAALRQAPDDRRSLADWARLSAMSERTLARLFRRETGLGFREWRQRLRLMLALTGLELGKSVTAAAMDSGYDSISAFIAAFRRLFGRTPGEFQSALRGG